jgi:hypothetical protein
MAAARTDPGAFVRGKLFIAGVDGNTAIATTLDVLQVVVMEVPTDDLRKWRRELDRALWRVRPPDRDTWGLLPEHVAAQERLIRSSPD